MLFVCGFLLRSVDVLQVPILNVPCFLFPSCRFGGLGVVNPTSIQFDASQQITAPLKELIIKQSVCAHPPDTQSIKSEQAYGN